MSSVFFVGLTRNIEQKVVTAILASTITSFTMSNNLGEIDYFDGRKYQMFSSESLVHEASFSGILLPSGKFHIYGLDYISSGTLAVSLYENCNELKQRTTIELSRDLKPDLSGVLTGDPIMPGLMCIKLSWLPQESSSLNLRLVKLNSYMTESLAEWSDQPRNNSSLTNRISDSGVGIAFKITQPIVSQF